MKTIMLGLTGLTLLGFAGTALGLDQVELDNRIRTLTSKFEGEVPGGGPAEQSFTATRAQ